MNMPSESLPARIVVLALGLVGLPNVVHCGTNLNRNHRFL